MQFLIDMIKKLTLLAGFLAICVSGYAQDDAQKAAAEAAAPEAPASETPEA